MGADKEGGPDHVKEGEALNKSRSEWEAVENGKLLVHRKVSKNVGPNSHSLSGEPRS